MNDITDDHTNECPVCGLDIRECAHSSDDENEIFLSKLDV